MNFLIIARWTCPRTGEPRNRVSLALPQRRRRPVAVSARSPFFGDRGDLSFFDGNDRLLRSPDVRRSSAGLCGGRFARIDGFAYVRIWGGITLHENGSSGQCRATP